MSSPTHRHPSISSTSLASIRNGVVAHPCLHVRDAHDAHVVLEAVRLNILPIIRRRLLTTEREELKSGHVYVWEEAQDDGGLLRWTDGKRWSQSRMRGDYLFYEEKVETTQEERDAKAARRARRASDPSAVLPLPTRRKDRPSKPDGLTKQTYSVSVHLPGSTETRKWHLVAYFSGNDYSRLPVVDDYDYLRTIQVPHAIFMNNKLYSSRVEYDRSSHLSDESDNIEEHINPNTQSSYSYSAPRRSPTLHYGGPGPHGVPAIPFGSPSLGSSSRFPDPSLRLPPITTNRLPPLLPSHGGMRRRMYSSEDRRVLDSFRVVL